MNAVITWLTPIEDAVVRWTGLSQPAAKVTLLIMLWLTPNMWAATIAVTCVQSWVQAQDAKSAQTASISRWSANRDVVCHIAKAHGLTERACAGR